MANQATVEKRAKIARLAPEAGDGQVQASSLASIAQSSILVSFAYIVSRNHLCNYYGGTATKPLQYKDFSNHRSHKFAPACDLVTVVWCNLSKQTINYHFDQVSTMLNRIILHQPTLAQTPAQPNSASSENSLLVPILLAPSAILLLVLIGGGLFVKFRIIKGLEKKIKFEEFKNKELQKKYKLAQATITKMETNPDLVHSREFNLEYLRMRMDEEVFHFAVVNQIKVKVKEQVGPALRGGNNKESTTGKGRKVSQTFDVTYNTGEGAKEKQRVLFRIQISLTKLPTQASSKTISDIIDCMETYLSPTADHNTWQPTIQGYMVGLHWDQKAKPTPLLVLDQRDEGNVTIRSNPRIMEDTHATSSSSFKSKAPRATSGKNPRGTSGKNRSSRTSRSR
ncbi:MAG: hypothetical protein AB4352_28865 [Hormoscilla sp.]